jgi:hypothetical protein
VASQGTFRDVTRNSRGDLGATMLHNASHHTGSHRAGQLLLFLESTVLSRTSNGYKISSSRFREVCATLALSIALTYLADHAHVFRARPGHPREATLITVLSTAGKEIIVACGLGGDLKAKAGASTGFQSQSLKAVYQLRKAGYTRVRHLQGGVGEYARSAGPLLSPDEVKASKLLRSANLVPK